MPVPKPDSIVHPFEGDADRARLKAALSARVWTSITLDYLGRSYGSPAEALTYLTALGKAYFLPAFIRMCQENPTAADVLPIALLNSLLRPNSDREAMLRGLTALQKEYFLNFLEGRFSEPSDTDRLLVPRKLLKDAGR